jgi:LmbE family N-acetylglucosaminyl deacetylase
MDLGADLVFLDQPDGELSVGPELIDRIGQVIRDTCARVILTHAIADSHQDHRAAAAATVAAARSHSQILHYESPTTLEFHPTVYSDITGLVTAKQDLLRQHISQVAGSLRVDLAAIAAQATYRGFQGRLTCAEAFVPTRTPLIIREDQPL